MKDDNFDLVLAIPCHSKKEKVIGSKVEKFSESFSDNFLKNEISKLNILNADYSESDLLKYANIFCEAIKHHGEYELIFNEDKNSITTERKPLAFGQVILYEDNMEDIISGEKNPICRYNFFAVLSELSINKSSVKKDSFFDTHTFNIIYFVVPDINYHNLTLLMDLSHELWCNIGGKIEPDFMAYLNNTFGYNYFGKIYYIMFSDSNQFSAIIKDDEHKLFNLLASEEYKNKDEFSHQLELSKSTTEYILNDKKFSLTKKEKFFDDYTMYKSYNAFASLYSYYYVINEEDKDSFEKRITPDPKNDFSSEGNILFVLENEIFKITACLVSSKEINEQINNPKMEEIKNMFRHFINTRPLFEKLNYRYLGAQKEADFIYKQFRISDMLADYDRKRELLKNYCEVNDSIISKRSTIILSLMGLLFALITGWDKFLSIWEKIINKNVIWDKELIIPIFILLFVIGIIAYIIQPVKRIKNFLRNRLKRVS